MEWKKAKKLFERHLALTVRQYSKLTNQHYNNARRTLRNWLFKGYLAMLICEERFPFAKKPVKVTYYCLPKNLKRVERWLSYYSNISVKKKLLLPKSLLEE